MEKILPAVTDPCISVINGTMEKMRPSLFCRIIVIQPHSRISSMNGIFLAVSVSLLLLFPVGESFLQLGENIKNKNIVPLQHWAKEPKKTPGKISVPILWGQNRIS